MSKRKDTKKTKTLADFFPVKTSDSAGDKNENIESEISSNEPQQSKKKIQ